MKKLEKLNSKKIAQLKSVLGGAGPLVDFSLEDSSSGDTTKHTSTKRRFEEHYHCDHTPD